MSIRFRVAAVTVLLSALVLVACATERDHRTSAAIGSGGGTLVASSGARLEVPPGAVELPTEFSMEVRDGAVSLPDGAASAGALLAMGPAGTTFATPVTLVLPASRAVPWVYTRSSPDAVWTRIDGGVYDAASRTITVRVTHFSDFVPAAEGDMPPPTVDCTDPAHARDPECLPPPPPTLPACDPVTQDCADGEKCIVTDQEGGYDWGDGRKARCVAAGAGGYAEPCVATTDCGRGLQCVFATMHDETTIWFSQEASYLPMYDSVCLPVCAIDAGATACETPGDACHPVQLWGFSGRDVNETYGVCAPLPGPPPPR